MTVSDDLLAVTGGLVVVGWVLTARALLRLRNRQAEQGERVSRLEGRANGRR